MVSIDENKNTSVLNNIESYLGTPSAQKILQILVCWETIPVKEIITKTIQGPRLQYGSGR